MLLETKSITQFALFWGSTWVVASLTIAVGADDGDGGDVDGEPDGDRASLAASGWCCSRCCARAICCPIGRLAFGSLVAESIVYAR